MPYITKNYGLAAFQLGEAYSATSDKNRFFAIDYQMFSMSRLIGDGRIEGWIPSDTSVTTNTLDLGDYTDSFSVGNRNAIIDITIHNLGSPGGTNITFMLNGVRTAGAGDYYPAVLDLTTNQRYIHFDFKVGNAPIVTECKYWQDIAGTAQGTFRICGSNVAVPNNTTDWTVLSEDFLLGGAAQMTFSVPDAAFYQVIPLIKSGVTNSTGYRHYALKNNEAIAGFTNQDAWWSEMEFKIGFIITTYEYNVSISSGMGLIGKVVTRTFGELGYQLSNDTTNYIYIQRKVKYIGMFSGSSQLVSIDYIDTTIPTAIATLTGTNITYNSITLEWDENIDVDFYQYVLQRSEDGFATYTIISSTNELNYTDIGLIEDTNYEYRIKAIDLSGNESVYTLTGIITTLQDLRPPTNPAYVLSFSGEGFIQILWQEPSFSTIIKRYEIAYTKLDIEFLPTNPVFTEIALPTDTSITLNNLENGFVYQIILYVISNNNVYSEGIILTFSPSFDSGPAEVTSLIVTANESTVNNNFLSLSIEWLPGINPYLLIAEKYIVTIIENGLIVSDSIISFNLNMIIENFIDLSTGLTRYILPRTDYIIKVQAQDINGNNNNGVVTRVKTINIVAPSAPSNIIASEQENGDILFSWINSRDVFNYNIISIIRQDLDTLVSSIILTNYNNAKSASYILTNVIPNSKYTIGITAIDEFGNTSSLTSFTIELSNAVLDSTTIPSNQTSYAGDGQIFLAWTALQEVLKIVSYKIFRAAYKTDELINSDFSLIDTISSSNTTYVDYSVTNGDNYFYLVTAVDIYGNESKNPMDDSFFTYPLVYAYTKHDDSYSIPENVVLSNSGVPGDFNANITWDEDFGDYDGYEIYRSKYNKHSWEKIGYVAKGISIFVDVDSLIKTSIVYYFIRKFRNEAKLVVKENLTNDLGHSLLLAKVVVEGGVVTIDDSLVNDLNNGGTNIDDYIQSQVDEHYHLLTTSDSRIDLRENIIITDWTTIDQQVYTTTEDFLGATSYIVKVNGIVSNIFYQIYPVDKKIVFSTITGTNSISVECIGVTEISNILPKEQLNEISATQIGYGKFVEGQIPVISHSGRTNESLIPLQLRLTTNDGYTFQILQNELITSPVNSMGNSTTFFDVMNISGIIYIATTNKGILYSSDGCVSWQIALLTDGVVNKLYYSALYGKYFVLGNGNVYVSGGGLIWAKMYGLDGVSIIRDITEDANNIYISTNIGVFKTSTIIGEMQWQQTTLSDATSSDFYGLYYDNVNNRILAGGEIGLLETFDQGITWTYVNDSEYDERTIILSFIKVGGSLFALTDDGILRENSIYFERIITTESNSRKFVVYNDRIVVSTNDGLFLSDENQNIYVSSIISTSKISGKISNFSSKIVGVTSLNVIGSNIFVGMDKKLFSGTDFVSDINLIYTDTGIVPTFYINKEEQRIGFSYNSNLVVFEQRVDDMFAVTVANQYIYFRAEHYGWLNQNYASTIQLNKNNILYQTFTGATLPLATLQDIIFDTFTESNSYLVGAQQSQIQFETELQRLVNINEGTSTFNTGENYQDIVTRLVYLYEKTYSNVIGKIRFSPIISISDTNWNILNHEYILSSLSEIVFSDYFLAPSIGAVEKIVPNIGQLDITTGIVIFDSELDKYDHMTLNIINSSINNSGINTHKQIDNGIELVNSFLPASLSQIQQSNLVKMGIAIEKLVQTQFNNYDNCKLLVSEPLNSLYSPITLSTSYTMTDSTMDYYPGFVQSVLGITSICPSSALYIDTLNKIFVLSKNILFSIDIFDGYSVSKVDIPNFDLYQYEYLKDILLIDNVIYLISDYHIFTSINGIDWLNITIKGVSGTLISIGLINNNVYVLATTNGVYYKNFLSSEWSFGLEISDIRLIYAFNAAFILIGNNTIYRSYNGSVWTIVNVIDDIQINNFAKYKKNMVVATHNGLRYDNSTFYGNNISLSLIDLKNDLVQSKNLSVNVITVNDNEDKYVVGIDNGDYYLFNTGVFTAFTMTGLDTVQQIVFINDSDYVLFGFDKFKISTVAGVKTLST